MAKAHVKSSPEPWPAEGLPLKAAIERVSGTVLSDAHASALFAGITHTTDEGARRIRDARHETERALSLLLDAWNNGALVATGRRVDPLSASVPIPPPGVTWRLRILDAGRSVIVDPGFDRKCIFDLRFWPIEMATSPSVASRPSASPVPPDPKDWLVGEVAQRRAADLIPEKITDFSRELATQMVAASRTGGVARALKARTIENMLRELKLFD
jgi:hypothetical protein